MEVLFTVLINIVISICGYVGIATSLVLIDGGKKIEESGSSELDFNELNIDYTQIPDRVSYKSRDETNIDYRYYSSKSNKVLILIHGSGWHSRYFFPLASNISENNYAHVYTPDLRGHGVNPETRGDIKYINQLENDLFDFIKTVKVRHPNSKIILGGHSSGGGLVVRYAGSKYGNEIDAYLLLSPFLKYNAPTMKNNSGGWASTHMPRIVGLSMLNNIGIKLFNNLDVIDFNMPKEYRDGTETLSYSYRLNTGYAPRNYKKDLSKMDKKLLVVAGSADESFKSEEYYSAISKYKPDVEVEIVNNVTHMGIVVGSEVRPIIHNFLKEVK
jgi:pimeloyl-ACP methyl ester carboxylesterase